MFKKKHIFFLFFFGQSINGETQIGLTRMKNGASTTAQNQSDVVFNDLARTRLFDCQKNGQYRYGQLYSSSSSLTHCMTI